MQVPGSRILPRRRPAKHGPNNQLGPKNNVAQKNDTDAITGDPSPVNPTPVNPTPVNPTPVNSTLVGRIEHIWPPRDWAGLVIVAAVSGGADSVAMLRAIDCLMKNQTTFSDADAAVAGCPPETELAPTSKPTSAPRRRPVGRIVVAHFNHARRGSDSDDDQTFVEQLADQLGLEFVFARQQTADSDEATMAAARRDFLRSTAMRLGARYVVLGHHGDDNVETMLHHLFRGSGPGGLCGMTTFHPDRASELVWARPMLFCHRAEILEFLQSIGQTFRDDASNRSVQYTRNWIRHEVMPRIKERFPAADRHIAATMGMLGSWRSAIESQAQTWTDQHVRSRAGEIEIAIGPDQPTASSINQPNDQPIDEAVVIAAMQMAWDRAGWGRGEMTQTHWSSVAAMIGGSPGIETMTLPGNIDARRSGGSVRFRAG